jgi:hypothetical protein
VLAWSAPLVARLPTALQQGKLADRGVPGVFLGKSALADDNNIGTETGIMRARSVKVLPVAEMPPNFLRRMRWTPWNPRALEPEGAVEEPPPQLPAERAADVTAVAARPMPDESDAQGATALESSLEAAATDLAEPAVSLKRDYSSLRGEGGGASTAAAKRLRAFLADEGATVKCPACVWPCGRKHIPACVT